MSEAFRCQGANLLPVTKFIGSGLFIKCLGQVDLPGAPLYITYRQPSPPGSAGLPSAPGGCGCGRSCGGAAGRWMRVWGDGLPHSGDGRTCQWGCNPIILWLTGMGWICFLNIRIMLILWSKWNRYDVDIPSL